MPNKQGTIACTQARWGLEQGVDQVGGKTIAELETLCARAGGDTRGFLRVDPALATQATQAAAPVAECITADEAQFKAEHGMTLTAPICGQQPQQSQGGWFSSWFGN